MPLWPKDWASGETPRNGRKPRAMIIWRANYLNQAKGNELIAEVALEGPRPDRRHQLPHGHHGALLDVVLPASSYYEKTDLNSTDCHSYMHPSARCSIRCSRAKTDWDIFRALAQKIAEVAAARNLTPFQDEAFDWARDFTRLYDDWSGRRRAVSDEARLRTSSSSTRRKPRA